MKLYAAPLQGFTEAPWRNFHEEVFGGIDAYYTPFVRIERGGFRNRGCTGHCSRKQYGFPCSASAHRVHSCRAGTVGRFVYRKRI